jgi:hypothetical protein
MNEPQGHALTRQRDWSILLIVGIFAPLIFGEVMVHYQLSLGYHVTELIVWGSIVVAGVFGALTGYCLAWQSQRVRMMVRILGPHVDETGVVAFVMGLGVIAIAVIQLTWSPPFLDLCLGWLVFTIVLFVVAVSLRVARFLHPR